MNLLFHCCCAPCSTACLESLATEGIEPHLFWYNPNIHPFTEYQSRRDALSGFAALHHIPLTMLDEYGLRPFIRGALPLMEAADGGPHEKRCAFCYRLRLEKTASHAANNGFDTFSSSLLASPYQGHDAIRRIGEEVAEQYGLGFYYRDFRSHFREGQARARSLGLYMQKYCGCIFSEEERYRNQRRAGEAAHGR